MPMRSKLQPLVNLCVIIADLDHQLCTSVLHSCIIVTRKRKNFYKISTLSLQSHFSRFSIFFNFKIKVNVYDTKLKTSPTTFPKSARLLKNCKKIAGTKVTTNNFPARQKSSFPFTLSFRLASNLVFGDT